MSNVPETFDAEETEKPSPTEPPANAVFRMSRRRIRGLYPAILAIADKHEPTTPLDVVSALQTLRKLEADTEELWELATEDEDEAEGDVTMADVAAEIDKLVETLMAAPNRPPSLARIVTELHRLEKLARRAHQ